MHRSSRLGLAVVAAALATVAGGAAASSAAAAVTCPSANSAIHGRGATFQKPAQDLWIADYPAFCNAQTGHAAGAVSYNVAGDPTGSGAGLTAFGANASAGVLPSSASAPNERDLRFAGTDEPPNTAQLAQIESPGDPANPSSTRRDVLEFPVAQGSITVSINLPDGCTLTGAALRADGRVRITNSRLANAFAGATSADTWGEVLGSGSVSCASTAVKRVVRQDESGTTFLFKKYLEKHGFPTGTANTAWPNDPTNLVRGNGNGGVATGITNNDGSLGYVVLSTARSNGFNFTGSGDDRYWLKLDQNQLSGGSVVPIPDGVDPSNNSSSGSTSSSTRSNCTDPSRERRYANVPPGPDPSQGGNAWTQTTSLKSEDPTSEDPEDFYTVNEYALCGLTFVMTWKDYSDAYGFPGSPFGLDCNQAANVHDYLEYILTTAAGGGQARVTGNDYDSLPGNVNTTDLRGDVNLIAC